MLVLAQRSKKYETNVKKHLSQLLKMVNTNNMKGH